MNDERNIIKDIETLKDRVSGALYVSQSTLNQAVNFIPAVLLDFRKFLNITVTDSLRFPNDEWDQYLKKELKDSGNVKTEAEVDDIEFSQATINSVQAIKRRLAQKISGEKIIFWNITGGQRPFIGAVFQLVAELNTQTHYIAYLEGNTGRMMVLDENMHKINNFDYSLSPEQMDIKRALRLMGFDVKKVESTRRKDKQSIIPESDKALVAKAKDKFFEVNADENTKDFRTELVLSNKQKSEVDFDDVIKRYLGKEYINENYHKNHIYKFGYLLEDMVAYIIQKDNDLWKQILDMGTSVKLEFSDDSLNKKYANKPLDEFDLLILNKYGQLINLECKSGGMSGDVAKSTKYSTYAIAGVYGLPVLITPFTEKEKKNLPIKKIHGEEDIYGYIKSSINKAEKYNLKIWGIDKVREQLRDYLIPKEPDENTKH